MSQEKEQHPTEGELAIQRVYEILGEARKSSLELQRVDLTHQIKEIVDINGTQGLVFYLGADRVDPKAVRDIMDPIRTETGFERSFSVKDYFHSKTKKLIDDKKRAIGKAQSGTQELRYRAHENSVGLAGQIGELQILSNYWRKNTSLDIVEDYFRKVQNQALTNAAKALGEYQNSKGLDQGSIELAMMRLVQSSMDYLGAKRLLGLVREKIATRSN